MTLTPKEKAVELVEKFKQINSKYVLNGEANDGDINDEAKECALVSVELRFEVGFEFVGIYYGEKSLQYWEQVKQEIQLL
jgi:hypothetical protein